MATQEDHGSASSQQQKTNGIERSPIPSATGAQAIISCPILGQGNISSNRISRLSLRPDDGLERSPSPQATESSSWALFIQAQQSAAWKADSVGGTTSVPGAADAETIVIHADHIDMVKFWEIEMRVK